jgi:hypothetical protein
MRISFRQEALELTFTMRLSCQCPLTDEQERALFDPLVALKPYDIIDCTEMLSIFQPHESTPITAPGAFQRVDGPGWLQENSR